MALNFSDEISSLEKSLRVIQDELAALEEKRDSHTVQTTRARAALDDLRAVLRGEVPPSQKKGRKSVRGIQSLPTNEESGRPARGARRQQIIDICTQLGQKDAIFRTADVLNVLREVEDEISTGVRSYVYAVMNTLEAESFIVKKGRGKWSLA